MREAGLRPAGQARLPEVCSKSRVFGRYKSKEEHHKRNFLQGVGWLLTIWRLGISSAVAWSTRHTLSWMHPTKLPANQCRRTKPGRYLSVQPPSCHFAVQYSAFSLPYFQVQNSNTRSSDIPYCGAYVTTCIILPTSSKVMEDVVRRLHAYYRFTFIPGGCSFSPRVGRLIML